MFVHDIKDILYYIVRCIILLNIMKVVINYNRACVSYAIKKHTHAYTCNNILDSDKEKEN